MMVTVDCPWCEARIPMDRPDVLACTDCGIEVALAPDVAAEVALAA